jgi:hypothetical protein
MSAEITLTLTLKLEDRYGTTHEAEITRVEFETDRSFFDRARCLLEKMREELS